MRPYQEEAIAAWFDHNCRGLLEMATGTGKTITALAASSRLYAQQNRLAVIIAVPYQHLVDQWAEEAAVFGYKPILAYRSKNSWLDRLNHDIIDFNGHYRSFISVITTYDTFVSADFQASVARLQGSVLLIADVSQAIYQKGLSVTDAEMKLLMIEKHTVCPQWNYTIRPRKTGSNL